MRIGWLKAWIAGCLAAAALAATQVGAEPTSVLSVGADEQAPGTSTSIPRQVTTTTTTTTTAGPSSSTTTAPAPATGQAPRATGTPRTASTPPPSAPTTAAPPGGGAARVPGPGLYVVAPDGTGLRKLSGECEDTFVRWIDGGRSLLVSRSRFTEFEVLGLDGGREVFDVPDFQFFWDAGSIGRSVVMTWTDANGSMQTSIFSLGGGRVDLGAGYLTPVVANDSRTIALFKYDGSFRLVDHQGTVLQDWRPSDFVAQMAQASWSPSNSHILGLDHAGNVAVVDVRTGATTSLPGLSPGQVNRWLDDRRIVAGRGGQSEGAPNFVEVRDWRTGAASVAVTGGNWPAVQRGTGLVVFGSHSPYGRVDAVSSDGSGRRALVLAGEGYRTTPLSWSPNQELVALSICGW